MYNVHILQRWEEGRRNRDGPGGDGTQILADTLTNGRSENPRGGK